VAGRRGRGRWWLVSGRASSVITRIASVHASLQYTHHFAHLQDGEDHRHYSGEEEEEEVYVSTVYVRTVYWHYL
jgi:hypothetical protein